MSSPSRAVLLTGVLVVSASLAHAGDRGAFAPASPDERVDLKPIVKSAPDVPPAPAVTVAEAPARSRGRAHRSRIARHAVKATAVAALPAASPPATVAVPQLADASANDMSGRTESAAPTPPATPDVGGPREAPSGTLSELLAKHAIANGVPLKLAQAVVTIESRGNVRASHGGALGLMQIKYGTARAAGFTGPAMGLFVADTNLHYGMKVLGEAYRAAGGDTCGALMRYQSGHYATHMNRANRIYCNKARSIMAGI